MQVWRLFLLLFLSSLMYACQVAPPEAKVRNYQELFGKTMGTTYSIKYYDAQERNLQGLIDSAFYLYNLEVSTYIPSSTISQFNQSERGIALSYQAETGVSENNQYFVANFKRGQEISTITEAAFQPTIMPLVNYWGFGYTEKRAVTSVDSLKVDTLLSFIGLDKIQMTEDSLIKMNPEVQLDFSGIAKGYGADLIAALLEEREIKDYFIEIGGDVLAKGLSPRGDDWVFGITVPLPEAGLMEFMTTAPLKNKAVATSGNYRIYFEVEGEKYGHTINPYTGFPEKNSLLSVSAFAKDAASADAFATACMVMGYEKASQLAEANAELEAYFIVGMPDGTMKTYFSSGLSDVFEKDQ